MTQIKLNIWQLFILISVIFFSTNIQAEEHQFRFPKAKYEWVKGKGVEVCKLYLQNLRKFHYAPSSYPHRIHPDFAEQLIHPPIENWRRLGQREYKLLYVRYHSFFLFGYQFYSDSGNEEVMRYWNSNLIRNLYALDLDINNDGQTETVVAHKSKSGSLWRVFVVAKLDEQAIDETLSYHLLWPRALLIEQETGEPPRFNFLSMTKLDKLIALAKENALSNSQLAQFKLIASAKENALSNKKLTRLTQLLIKFEAKNYSKEKMLDILQNRIYLNGLDRYIQDDFFIYAGKTYMTSVFWGLNIAPPSRHFFRIYTTEHDKTTEVCVYRWYR